MKKYKQKPFLIFYCFPTHFSHPGNPQPAPINKYKAINTTNAITKFHRMFFHHRCLFNAVERCLNAKAAVFRESVFSTRISIRSPRSRMRSMFWCITFFTVSNSPWTREVMLVDGAEEEWKSENGDAKSRALTEFYKYIIHK